MGYSQGDIQAKFPKKREHDGLPLILFMVKIMAIAYRKSLQNFQS